MYKGYCVMYKFNSLCAKCISLCAKKKTFRYVHDVTFGHVLKKLKFAQARGGRGGGGSAGKIFATLLV